MDRVGSLGINIYIYDQLISDNGLPRKFNEEKIVSWTLVLGQLDIYVQKKNLDFCTLYTNINSKWIILEHKSYNYKTSKRKHRRKSIYQHLGLGKEFLDMQPKAQYIKEEKW